MNFPVGERKQSAKFWAPHPSAPTLQAPHPSGPHFFWVRAPAPKAPHPPAPLRRTTLRRTTLRRTTLQRTTLRRTTLRRTTLRRTTLRRTTLRRTSGNPPADNPKFRSFFFIPPATIFHSSFWVVSLSRGRRGPDLRPSDPGTRGRGGGAGGPEHPPQTWVPQTQGPKEGGGQLIPLNRRHCSRGFTSLLALLDVRIDLGELLVAHDSARPDSAVERHDAACGAVSMPCGSPRVPTDAQVTASFPLSMGGLRPTSAVRSRVAAHWASWADTLPMVRIRHRAIAESFVEALVTGVGPVSLVEAEDSRRNLTGVMGFEPPSWPALAAGARPPPPPLDDPGGWRTGWQHEAASRVERHFRDTNLMPRLKRH